MSLEAIGQDSARKKPDSLRYPHQTRWKTIAQERIYRQRLLDAIKSARETSQSSKISLSRGIKEGADSALAIAAKGQTRWSRAILSRRRRFIGRRLSIKAGGRIRRCSGQRFTEDSSDPVRSQSEHQKRMVLLKKKKKAATEEGKLEERFSALSRVVPGARKLSTPELLEETADYVAALQMQVKAMRELADLLSSTSISSPPPSDET